MTNALCKSVKLNLFSFKFVLLEMIQVVEDLIKYEYMNFEYNKIYHLKREF